MKEFLEALHDENVVGALVILTLVGGPMLLILLAGLARFVLVLVRGYPPKSCDCCEDDEDDQEG